MGFNSAPTLTGVGSSVDSLNAQGDPSLGIGGQSIGQSDLGFLSGQGASADAAGLNGLFSGGTNALAPLDWTASLYLRWSFRAFDGTTQP